MESAMNFGNMFQGSTRQIKFPVFGLYLGNSSASVALCKEDGSVNVLSNSLGDRITPSVVAISKSEVVVGTAASAKLVSPGTYTVATNCKLLMTQQLRHRELVRSRNTSARLQDDGSIMYEVPTGTNKVKTYSAIDIATYIFESLYETASNFIQEESIADAKNKKAPTRKNPRRKSTRTNDQSEVDDLVNCVLAVPPYFDKHNIDTILVAAQRAKWRVLQVVHEPSAALLAYNVNVTEPLNNSIVIVYRAGGTTCDSTLFHINNGYVFKRSTLHNLVGGENIICAVQKYLREDIERKLDVKLDSSVRTTRKIRQCAENCMRVLSNIPSVTCSIESVADGKDYTGSLSLAKFEVLIAPMLRQFSQPVYECLIAANVHISDVNKALLCGGVLSVRKLKMHITGLFPNAQIYDNDEPDFIITRGAALEAQFVAQFGDPSQAPFGPTDTL